MNFGKLFKKSKQPSPSIAQVNANSSNSAGEAFIPDPLMQKSNQNTISSKKSGSPIVSQSTYDLLATEPTFAYIPSSTSFHPPSWFISASGKESPHISPPSPQPSGGTPSPQPSGGTPSPQPSGGTPSYTEAPYYPTFPEFVALLHQQIQQVIEHLAQPEYHKRFINAPSQAFAKIEHMNIDIPITIMPRIVKFPEKVDVTTFKPLAQPFNIPGSKTNLYMRVGILNPKTDQTTPQGAMLRVEFSIAAK